jgi:hypothetical protein
MVILDILLVVVYLVLRFTAFKEPSYVPFASGSVSTLVPDGPYSSTIDGAWERHRFNGKGDFVISVRNLGSSELGELVRRNRSDARAADNTELGRLVKRALGDTTVAGEGEGSAMRIEAGRTYLQILASNTPNMRLREEVPAFDSTIFCLGAVGRGDRRYRYLVHSGDTIVDLNMHSPHSSHIVYKKVLDKALLSLRVDGQSSNHILGQALADISDQISPRWAQGNVFWLVFFLALPNGIMLIILPILVLAGRRRESAPGSSAP